MNRSVTNTTLMASASVRSRNRYAMPSRARSGSRALRHDRRRAPGRQDERGQRDHAEASPRSRASPPPCRRSRPARRRSAGRRSCRRSARSPRARSPRSGRSPPATTGTSENSAGWANANPVPSRAASTRIAATSRARARARRPRPSARATPRAGPPRASSRSTTSPATGASTTTGVHSARNRPAIARPESLISWRCSVSGIQSRKSPSAEMPTAPTIRRTSRLRERHCGPCSAVSPARGLPRHPGCAPPCDSR